MSSRGRLTDIAGIEIDVERVGAGPPVLLLVGEDGDGEKIGPHKVRITTKAPTATDLGTIAYQLYIVDSKIHKTLKRPSDYGRVSASGTGPYRMVSIDKARGAVIERFDNYRGNKNYAKASIKRVVVTPMPDAQTQIAQLLTGGVDIIRGTQSDTAKQLTKNPKITSTNMPVHSFAYLMLDAAGRSKFKPMQDVRVRKAIMMGINRGPMVRNLVAGGESAELMDRICFKETAHCSGRNAPPSFDPEGAKKLLAEAGYPNGFELPLFVHAPIKVIGESISGQLRKIGIRSSIQALPISVYVKKRIAGELTAFVGIRPLGGFPDMSYVMDSFFRGSRDYWKDPVMSKIRKDGIKEFDSTKRSAIYRPALDRVNELAYILPISSLPAVFIHSNNVKVSRNPASAGSTDITDFSWK